MGKQKNQQNPWENFIGPNFGYVQEQYEKYLRGIDQIDSGLKELFVKWDSPLSLEINQMEEPNHSIPSNIPNLEKVLKTRELVEELRSYGHLSANINPLDDDNKDHDVLNLNKFGLTKEDLNAIPASVVWEEAPTEVQTAWDTVNHLKVMYTSSLAFEFDHVQHAEERKWLRQMVEKSFLHHCELTNTERKNLLTRLTEVECFEQFLHKTFVGQKRFSIEGVDMLVPMLDQIVREVARDSAHNVVIGMAHRGRLSVLAHVLEKPYNKIFSEFQHSSAKQKDVPRELLESGEGWSGDVKYHLGYNRFIASSGTARTRVTLANNPSHLEFVDPVVEGFTRAAQEVRTKLGFPKRSHLKAIAILVHGDAAFPGQGIVSETLNLGRLKGYQTGGTIHIITNNMVGFTTDSHDSRSTRYASDLAKGYEIPIVHVNADDPEACLAAVNLAYQYRIRFQKDFLIDLVGYRRFGHNEMDDPAVTQPKMYKKVAKHQTVRALYAEALQKSGTLSQIDIEQINRNIQELLQTENEKASEMKDVPADKLEVPAVIANGIPPMNTCVSINTLRELNTQLLDWPNDFHVYPKLKRILERRKNALEDKGKIEWALAESLAFATILKDGTPIRLTGQDSERGTFAHRHIVLHDTETNETFSPLQNLPEARASFAVYNSPLSEAAVVGFEYGYNVFAPETLVIWEAQYGDFANTAQAIFDQFISAGRAKWGQKSGLVLLLPHGYEGQGPEHSSARPERFLQMAAENNWTVANLTSAAQYFHILRRQAAALGTEYIRPLVIMTPKSLLRHPLTACTSTDLTEGHFHTVIEQEHLRKEDSKIKRLVVTTGKMAIDIAAEAESKKEYSNANEVHVIRIEQLYPFPKEKVEVIVQRYPNLEEIVWVQEEPKNMGAWHFVFPILSELASGKITVSYIGRPDRSSPAGGDPTVHKEEQEQIIQQALNINQLLDKEKHERVLVHS